MRPLDCCVVRLNRPVCRRSPLHRLHRHLVNPASHSRLPRPCLSLGEVVASLLTVPAVSSLFRDPRFLLSQVLNPPLAGHQYREERRVRPRGLLMLARLIRHAGPTLIPPSGELQTIPLIPPRVDPASGEVRRRTRLPVVVSGPGLVIRYRKYTSINPPGQWGHLGLVVTLGQAERVVRTEERELIVGLRSALARDFAPVMALLRLVVMVLLHFDP